MTAQERDKCDVFYVCMRVCMRSALRRTLKLSQGAMRGDSRSVISQPVSHSETSPANVSPLFPT